MSQYYVGIKQVFAWPEEKNGKPGYAVVYRYGQPDAYQSWSPKDEFEKFYLPQGNDPTRVTQAMVDGFIADGTHPATVGGKMTVLNVELRNGTLYAESSACVDPANYDEKLGADICLKRAKDRVWHLLGFALQWARRGLATVLAVLVLTGVAKAAPPQAPTPPQAPPVKADDGETYEQFRQGIAAGQYGYLLIGNVERVKEYVHQFRIQSGSLGKDFPDGVYECYRDDRTGKAMMRPHRKLVEAAAPPPVVASPTFEFQGGFQQLGNVVRYCTKSGCYYVPAK